MINLTSRIPAILAQEGDVTLFSEKPDGIGAWLESNLQTVALLLLIAMVITIAFQQMKGQRGGMGRTIAGGLFVAALLTNLGLLLTGTEVVADLVQRVLNEFS